MLVECERVVKEHAQLGHVPSEEVAGALRRHDAAGALGQVELILYVDDLADVVENLEAVDELTALLRVV